MHFSCVIVILVYIHVLLINIVAHATQVHAYYTVCEGQMCSWRMPPAGTRFHVRGNIFLECAEVEGILMLSILRFYHMKSHEWQENHDCSHVWEKPNGMLYILSNPVWMESYRSRNVLPEHSIKQSTSIQEMIKHIPQVHLLKRNLHTANVLKLVETFYAPACLPSNGDCVWWYCFWWYSTLNSVEFLIKSGSKLAVFQFQIQVML